MIPITITTAAIPTIMGSRLDSSFCGASGGPVKPPITRDCRLLIFDCRFEPVWGRIQQSKFNNSLFSADRQSVDADGWRRHSASKYEVIANLGDVHKNILQIAGDRDLLDWKGEFAPGNPKA